MYIIFCIWYIKSFYAINVYPLFTIAGIYRYKLKWFNEIDTKHVGKTPLPPVNSAVFFFFGGGDMMLHLVACLPSFTCAVVSYNCLIVLMLTADLFVIEQTDLPWLAHISLDWLPDHDSWQIPELAQVIVMIPVERQVMLQGNQYQL